MLVIRFSRVGRHNHAQYRIIVQEKTKAPTGKHIAIVGSYDPHLKQAVLDKEKITHFIANGAQPSDSVYNLLVREGVIDGKKRPVKIPAKKQEKEEKEEKDVSTDKKDDASEASDDNADVKEDTKEETQKGSHEEKPQEKPEKEISQETDDKKS